MWPLRVHCGLVANAAQAVRPFPLQVRFNSRQVFEELKATVKGDKATKDEEKKFSALNTIDTLLKGTAVDSRANRMNNAGYSSFGLGRNNNGRGDNIFENATAPNPRDVAKGISIRSPLAGRTADVQYGNLGRALSQLNTTIRTNRIRYFKKVQARHIPRAKYRKQRKREWWRRNFSAGFKKLMAQVRDANRRGY